MAITSTDDLAGIPHVVILRRHGQIEVHQFEGEECDMKAHEFGISQMDSDGVDNIVICCRLHTLSRKRDRIGQVHN